MFMVLRKVLFVLLLEQLATRAAVALYTEGDKVSMSHRSKVTGSDEQKREAPWEEGLRSQTPRFGRPATVHFKPILPDGASYSPDEDELAVVLAFSQERFVLRRVLLRKEGGGGKGGHLDRLVVTFACAGGDIVNVRSDPVYGDTKSATSGGAATAAEVPGFEIEYRWDRLPEEDAEAGIWVVFAASLVLTAVLAVDVCNSNAGGENDRNDDYGQVGMSSSSGLRGRGGDAMTARVGSGGGALRLGGGDELRRRK